MKIFCSILLCLILVSCAKEESINLSQSPVNPEIFAKGIISTHLYERDLAISPNNKEILYTLSDLNQSQRCLIHLVNKKNQWSNPELFIHSGRYNDIEPFFHPNGNVLLFASDRPLDSADKTLDYNIWYCKKEGLSWSAPLPFDSIINTDADEFYPSVSSNGNLYFTSSRLTGIGLEDIFISKYVNNTYQTPIALDTNINSDKYEFNAYINPNEDLIVFSSYGRQDGFGGGDLYASTRNDDGSWNKAVNLGEKINSNKLDFCPFINWENGTFYYTSNYFEKGATHFESIDQLISSSTRIKNGGGNIYCISLDALGIK